ncbi:MAG: hypothetical protein ABFR35_08115 [Thermodesulfobacteriota bacterium]
MEIYLNYIANIIKEQLLLSLFVVSMSAYLFFSLNKVGRSFNKITKDVRKFRKNILRAVSVDDKKKEVKILEHLSDNKTAVTWELLDSDIKNVFLKSIFKYEWHSVRENCSFKNSEGGVMRFDSERSYNIFSLENIEDNHLPMSFLGFCGNFLISLGVIGTFLGLVLGVNSASTGLASTDAAVARESLKELLDGAGLAFITSLLGITYSTLLSGYKMKKEAKLEKEASFTGKCIRSIFPFHESSTILYEVRDNTSDIMTALIKQNKYLSGDN